MQSGKIVPTTLVQQLVVQAIRSNESSSDGATAHVLLGRTQLTLTPARTSTFLIQASALTLTRSRLTSPSPPLPPHPHPHPHPHQVLPDSP